MNVTVVLVAGGGAAWEAGALEVLGARSGVVVLKRCVDVDDLLAAASSGQADVAVVGLDAHGLDLAAVDLMRRHGVRTVAVVPSGTPPEAAQVRASRIGLRLLVAEEQVGLLGDAVTAPEPSDEPERAPVAPVEPGRVVAVWGPSGAPGRSTVATTLAATLAARGRRAVLVDADPWGGSIAQQLGILDEVSGLLAAARLSGSGVLEERFPTVLRALGRHLEVLTGLPRADRWPEVREGVVEEVLELASRRGHVVVDAGSSLERDPTLDLAGRPGRTGATLTAVGAADDLLVVGTADPVGLSRLARGLVDLSEETGGRPVHVVVNRLRPSLGWSAAEVEQMVRGFADVASTTFLPEDQASTDRALVTGRSVVEVGDGPLASAVAGLAEQVFGARVSPARERGTGRAATTLLRPRRAGRARRR
jgi:MinD-like ATPase involved in chromosome partitioning or flagellar assembly